MNDHPEDLDAFVGFKGDAEKKAERPHADADFEALVQELYRRFDTVVILAKKDLKDDCYEFRVRHSGKLLEAIALCVRGANYFDARMRKAEAD